MATKKSPAPKPKTEAPAPPPEPVENKSGHLHVFERVNGMGTGETIEFCTICAATRKV